MDAIFTSIISYVEVAALAIFSFVAAMIPSTTASEVICINDQIARMEVLAEEYASGEAEAINEQYFCNFDINDTADYSFDDFQMIGTHNSYKLYQSELSYLISSTLFPLFGEDGDVMNYEHENTTDQLNMGIRSFEWDVVEYDGMFEGYLIQHEAYIDTNSSIPNLKLALEEVLMWSEYNENHMPITIIIECKDQAIPSADKTAISDSQAVVELSDYISSILGDTLYTPADMVGDYDSMLSMRLADDYPSLAELQGKVLILLHTGDACLDYAEDVAFEDQDLFITEQTDDSCFTILAQTITPIREALEENFMVRCSINVWGSESNQTSEYFVDLGVNILTSDFVYENQSYEATRIDEIYTMGIID
ncbi:MAG: Ca2+-dependent phosphoinositide-specific phospholipase C [Clostridia bacterium]